MGNTKIQEVLMALMACWIDPILKTCVQRGIDEAFVRIVDLADYINASREANEKNITPQTVEIVLREDLFLEVRSHRGFGYCVRLDSEKIAKKIWDEKKKNELPPEKVFLKRTVTRKMRRIYR